MNRILKLSIIVFLITSSVLVGTTDVNAQTTSTSCDESNGFTERDIVIDFFPDRSICCQDGSDGVSTNGSSSGDQCQDREGNQTPHTAQGVFCPRGSLMDRGAGFGTPTCIRPGGEYDGQTFEGCISHTTGPYGNYYVQNPDGSQTNNLTEICTTDNLDDAYIYDESSDCPCGDGARPRLGNEACSVTCEGEGGIFNPSQIAPTTPSTSGEGQQPWNAGAKPKVTGDNDTVSTGLGPIEATGAGIGNALFGIFFWLGSGLVLIRIVTGAFKIITSTGDPAKIADGRGEIISAIIGALVVISAVIIMNTLGIALDIPGLPDSF